MLETPLGGALLAILIGLLLGLERERSHSAEERLFAGVRTFPLLVLAGFLGGRAAEQGVPMLLPAVLLGTAALAVASYVATSREHIGATTEALAMLAPLLGAAIAWGEASLAASIAVIITFLLTLKTPLHRIAGAVSETEIVAILKFALVAVVLVPLLPVEPAGPYGAIVPRHVGIVVVIVCAVSLVGYLLVRVLGGRAGWALVGLVGGLVSSTAVTLSLSGTARRLPHLVRPLAAGILLASMVLYARSALLIGLFDLELALHLAPRLAGIFLVAAAFAFREWRSGGSDEKSGAIGLGNPVELGSALLLGLLFAGILLAGRAAQANLGSAGLWATGAVGGLVDVDSVALANARLHGEGIAPLRAAAGSFLLATLANLLVKGGVTFVAGGATLAKRVLPAFAAVAAATVVAVLV